jgi:hypothetical protein
MWELICYHTYKLEGLPIDLSRYETVAEKAAAAFLPDGIEAGSGILRFEQPSSRVRILVETGSPWLRLGGIRVEVTARVLRRAGHWQTLVAADGAFRWFLRDEDLIAEYPVAPGTSTLAWAFSGGDHDGLSTAEHGAGFVAYEHQDDAWRTFGFAHDGIDTVVLTVDGDVVARRQGLRAGIPGVGTAGVHIGNAPGTAGHCLEGDIDDVKAWRLDPDAMKRLFLSRPFDEATAACWEKLFRRIADTLARHPDCRRQLASDLPTMLDRLHRAIVQSSPHARERFARLRAEYARLWRAGQLGGPDMAAVFTELCGLLHREGLSLADDPAVVALTASPCMTIVRNASAGVDLECDPDVVALAGEIAKACGDPAPSAV